MKDLLYLWRNGLMAFGLWGISPIFWKQLKTINSFDLVTIRIPITFLTIGLICFLKKDIPELQVLKKRKSFLKILQPTLLIGLNWFIFIFAVNEGYILQASLGYFISPLLTFLLGTIVLRETVNKYQLISLILFATAIVILSLATHQFPWIALSLSSTFAIYGLLKKRTSYSPSHSMFFETLLLMPGCVIYLILIKPSIGSSLKEVLFLSLSGLFTYMPLFFFAKAAKELKFTELGTLQYLAPIGQFMVGYFLYNEALEKGALFAYSLVWLGIIIFTRQSLISIKRSNENI